MEMDEVRRIAREKRSGWVEAFESAVARLYAENGPSSIPELFSLFSEDIPDEVKFSVIHCAEQARAEQYAEGVVSYVTRYGDFNNEWTDIVHFRLMNGPTNFTEYLRILSRAPDEVKDRMKAYVHRLASDPHNERFQSGLQSLLGALS